MNYIVKLWENSSFSAKYTTYCLTGLSICNLFAFLRGRGPKSVFGLCVFRAYLLSLLWLPVQHLTSPFSLFSNLILLYYPIYSDLSEFHFGYRWSSWLKCSFLGPLLKNYFKMRLIRTVPIEDKQCIIGIHPHAILPLGSIINIISNENKFDELFPTLKNRVVLAASSCFIFPFYREILISNNIHDCSRFCAEKWLENGHTICIVPGGAKEALYSNPQEDWLDLKRKHGFIKLALESGVKIIPTFTFNEVDYCKQIHYNTIPSWLESIRLYLFQRTVGLSLPFAYQLFTSNCELITVIGKPIQLPHIKNPTKLEIESAMNIYCSAVQILYDDHAVNYNSVPRTLRID
jgi:hypothetical protein